MKDLLRRLSIYGDFWLRYLHWGARHCPWFLEPMFIAAFTAMFWCVLRQGRRAVARNLAVIIPGSSPLMNHLRVFRVFWNFACSLADVAHSRQGGSGSIRWEVSGREHLEELENLASGAILITAHMGNYDLAAPLFAQRIHKPIHLVRSPERQRESQDFEKAKRDRQVTGNFVIHYNEPGNMLAVTLAQAIDAGGIVAVQGDRVLFDVSPMKVPFKDGQHWQIPRGPFMLALVARVPLHPVFVIRMGWRRYRIQAEPVIEVPHHDRDRERVQAETAAKWTAVVRSVGERHWRQWFVFEEMFDSGRTQGAGSNEQVKEIERSVEAPPDIVIPADSRRSVPAVLLWNAFAGAWTSAVVLRRLLEWAVGDWLHVAGAVVIWPIAWFVAMVALVQATLGGALLVMKASRLPSRLCDPIANALTLAAFAAVAWSEWVSGCPVGWWLGAIGLAGIAAGLVQEAISRTSRE